MLGGGSAARRALVLGSSGVLIYFIHHIAEPIQLPRVIENLFPHRTSLLGDFCLLGVGDVHDDAAF